mmetsp:Transcript_9223/g.13708  ORF Transcript_9223/g.13708 Transcript_9223/m.13708 type:complete len:302 (-) Transcript_9223:41-946(-)|eukprot:CAMPEP_0202435846 /NCGR_PEP_ID=MMETSP1345-20130828/21569_1 /ASSEMBLY_ACC=CAM_ASM_000843 /TAXON_ID=342563 /ORGANISM="Fabrea Fabrea salina" /LENGTH=301 /DNA_ID=CAMNT_0049048999 /DNA_START=54 /DNA_END=959 /DNA_ORIENTATION=-
MNLISHLEGHSDRVWQVNWSPSGDLLASCSADKTVKIWKATPEWTCLETLQGDHTKSVRGVTWSYSGELLATASFDGTCVIYKVNSFEGVLTLEGHENEVKAVSFSYDDRFFATCGRDKTVWVWETDPDFEYETVAVLSRHTQDVKCVKFHPSKNLLASGSYDNTIGIWEEEGDEWVCKDMLVGHEGTVWSLAWNGDDLISVSEDLTMKVWRFEEERFRQHKTFSGVHSRQIYTVDHRNNLTVTGGGDDSIALYSNYQVLNVYQNAHGMDVNSVAINPVDSLLASASDDNTVKVWKLDDFE